jgi:hypothetical protein
MIHPLFENLDYKRKKVSQSSSNVSKMKTIFELHALIAFNKMGDDIVKIKK